MDGSVPCSEPQRPDGSRGASRAVLADSGKDCGVPADDRLVLVVDDDDHVRGYLTKLLSRSGFCCLEACDAEQALELLAEHRPHLAVLDIALPGISGAELAWRIRERELDIPLVTVSGQLELWDPDDLTDLGFSRILSKPFEPNHLVRVCRQLCDGGDASQLGEKADG